RRARRPGRAAPPRRAMPRGAPEGRGACASGASGAANAADAAPPARTTRRRSSGLERNLGNRPARLVRLEEGPLREAEQAGNQVAREGLHEDVEVAGGAVVIAPRHLDLVLDAGERGLQLQEVFARLQVRIVL